MAQLDRAETSVIWTEVGGAFRISLIGPFFWLPPAGMDWLSMAALCLTGITGRFLLIKAYDVTEFSTLQPFAYLHLVFALAVGVWAFGDVIDNYSLLGASIIVTAGFFIF